jgi:hypothetical protein
LDTWAVVDIAELPPHERQLRLANARSEGKD